MTMPEPSPTKIDTPWPFPKNPITDDEDNLDDKEQPPKPEPKPDLH